MIFTLAQLAEKSKHRPQGYYQDVMALATKISDTHYELDDKKFAQIALKYRLPSKIQMLNNIVTAFLSAAKDGTEYRRAEDVKRVLSICIQCPLYIDQQYPRCGDCGCFLGGVDESGKVKFGKSMLKNWKCQLGKWDYADPVA